MLDILRRDNAVEEVGGEDLGGEAFVHELAVTATATQNARHFAQIVVDHARRREELAAAKQLQAATATGGLADDPDLRARLLRLVEHASAAATQDQLHRFVDGATFVLDAPADIPTVWGDGTQVAWAQGESLMLVGPQGVGKTTIAQQLALARIGVRTHVLGWPVTEADRPVVYIAADRPSQAQRSIARMVTEEHRGQLAERLTVWKGPLPFDLIRDPRALADFVAAQNAGTIIIDSLKDIAVKLSDEETAAAINHAVQHLLAAGVEVLELHHQRKATGDNSKPDKLADVYGNTWLTAGVGSVFLLWGDPGDPVVRLKHLKQPAEEIGPYDVVHDHTTGLTRLDDVPDLLSILHRRGTTGITANDAAIEIYRKQDVTRSEVEKARRRLDALATAGHAVAMPGVRGGQPATWYHNAGRQDTP